MDIRIEILSEKILVGKQLKMSLSNDRTFELWRSFMPRRKEIKNSLTPDLICIQVYDSSLDFKEFDANTEWEKWAAVEVADLDYVPDDMEAYILPGGLYAAFIYQGTPAAFGETFQFILNTWLPQSAYELDSRPHFEILGARYKNNDPDSEEEVWIPVREKRLKKGLK